MIFSKFQNYDNNIPTNIDPWIPSEEQNSYDEEANEFHEVLNPNNASEEIHENAHQHGPQNISFFVEDRPNIKTFLITFGITLSISLIIIMIFLGFDGPLDNYFSEFVFLTGMD